LIGNLGRDPEARFTANGRKYASFSVAVNHAWSSGEGEKQETITFITGLHQAGMLFCTRKSPFESAAPGRPPGKTRRYNLTEYRSTSFFEIMEQA